MPYFWAGTFPSGAVEIKLTAGRDQPPIVEAAPEGSSFFTHCRDRCRCSEPVLSMWKMASKVPGQEVTHRNSSGLNTGKWPHLFSREAGNSSTHVLRRCRIHTTVSAASSALTPPNLYKVLLLKVLIVASISHAFLCFCDWCLHSVLRSGMSIWWQVSCSVNICQESEWINTYSICEHSEEISSHCIWGHGHPHLRDINKSCVPIQSTAKKDWSWFGQSSKSAHFFFLKRVLERCLVNFLSHFSWQWIDIQLNQDRWASRHIHF